MGRAEQEWASAQLGDKRLNRRLVKVTQKLADKPMPATRLVQMGDRESVILELMAKAQSLQWPVDVLVRSQHNRVLPEGKKLWDKVHVASTQRDSNDPRCHNLRSVAWR